MDGAAGAAQRDRARGAVLGAAVRRQHRGKGVAQEAAHRVADAALELRRHAERQTVHLQGAHFLVLGHKFGEQTEEIVA